MSMRLRELQRLPPLRPLQPAMPHPLLPLLPRRPTGAARRLQLPLLLPVVVPLRRAARLAVAPPALPLPPVSQLRG